VPFELVKVVVTPMNGTVLPGGPVKENCTVILNVLPKAFELGLLYHAAKALVRGTVTSKVDGCVFVGNVKWNSALVISRIDENPVTTMLNPLRVTAQGMTPPVMTGGVALTVMTTGAGGESIVPLESRRVVVMVIVPATVPTITGTLTVVLP
jgi:hypothetical protein